MREMRDSIGNVFEHAHEIVGKVRDLDLRHGISNEIDREFLALARRVGGVAGNELFTVVDDEYTKSQPRPDAINHHLTLLPPNVMSSEEQENVLLLLNLMHGDQVDVLTQKFADFAREYDIFERMRDKGHKFIFSGSHLVLPDPGFNLGYMHKAARLQGIDRLENMSTITVGRLLGYYKLDTDSVMDGVLRKAGNVLKVFPVSGGESLNEAQAESELGLLLRHFRRAGNKKSRQVFRDLMSGPGGHQIFQANGGAQEIPKEGVVNMHPMSEGSQEDMVYACENGAEVVPIFADYGFDHSLVEFGEPRRITADQVHEIGDEIAKLGNAARADAQKTHLHVERFKDTIVHSVA